ncbi:MAG: enoyl-CoA hydratase/isomerase family protein [Myxococcota bacterium]|nr:enoyl-CoA hydratase/isomerase family protein [Myxococcota bacterium]
MNPNDEAALVVRSHLNGVTTLRLNLPRRLNGWTSEMMAALQLNLDAARDDEATKAVILTGTDPYFCAGVNLAGTLKLDHPKTLYQLIKAHNQSLFDQFLDFDKPILVAVNGPAIGAAVTSATLCDAIIASEHATFSTPFAALGVCPEGCSSVNFARLMGEENARRMLFDEGWVPTAAEALDAGLIDEVVPPDQLMPRAQAMCEAWIAAGRERQHKGGLSREALKAINAQESEALARCFLDAPFLKGQFQFLWRKKKRGPALMFLSLWWSRPLWSKLL